MGKFLENHEASIWMSRNVEIFFHGLSVLLDSKTMCWKLWINLVLPHLAPDDNVRWFASQKTCDPSQGESRIMLWPSPRILPVFFAQFTVLLAEWSCLSCFSLFQLRVMAVKLAVLLAALGVCKGETESQLHSRGHLGWFSSSWLGNSYI